MKYDHKSVEKKWQKFWDKEKTFKCTVDQSKPKYYVSGYVSLSFRIRPHVGHVEGYTATDIVARYKRQKGFNVLASDGMGQLWLPAEQYAIRTGTHPAVTTQKNIDNFRRQLQSLGFQLRLGPRICHQRSYLLQMDPMDFHKAL